MSLGSYTSVVTLVKLYLSPLLHMSTRDCVNLVELRLFGLTSLTTKEGY